MRIGINISNDLMEKFKPLKGSYNLSRICRDAVKSYIEAYEKAVNQAKSDDMQDVAKRLFGQYSRKMDVDWESVGRNDARVWAQLASLDDLEGFFYNLKVHKKLGRSEPGPYLFPRLLGEAPRFENHISEHDGWFARQIELDESANPYITAKQDYHRGWLSYLTAVWQMVKEQIADDKAAMEKILKEEREKSLKEGLREGKARAEILAKQ